MFFVGWLPVIFFLRHHGRSPVRAAGRAENIRLDKGEPEFTYLSDC